MRFFGLVSKLLTCCLLASSSVCCFAAETKPAFPVSKSGSRIVQKVTGLTWIGELIADEAASMALKHKVGGKVSVKIKSYSLGDLLAGKFEKLQIKTRGGAISGIPIGKIEVSSQSSFWYQYRNSKGKPRD